MVTIAVKAKKAGNPPVANLLYFQPNYGRDERI